MKNYISAATAFFNTFLQLSWNFNCGPNSRLFAHLFLSFSLCCIHKGELMAYCIIKILSSALFHREWSTGCSLLSTLSRRNFYLIPESNTNFIEICFLWFFVVWKVSCKTYSGFNTDRRRANATFIQMTTKHASGWNPLEEKEIFSPSHTQVYIRFFIEILELAIPAHRDVCIWNSDAKLFATFTARFISKAAVPSHTKTKLLLDVMSRL